MTASEPADAVEAYRRLVARLGAAAARRDADLTSAERSYVDGLASAGAELAAAEATVERFNHRVVAAAAALVETDQEAARVWAGLHAVAGWRGRRLGAVPDPVEAPPGESPRRLLAAALHRLGQTGPGTARPPLPRLVLPILPLVGAAVAGLLGLVAGGLVAVGAESTVLRVLGWLTFLVAPLAGVPVAALWVDRRFGSRLDSGAIGLIVIGGMVAGCALSLGLR